eukprot:UN26188
MLKVNESYFTLDDLEDSPNRMDGINYDQDVELRRHFARFIQTAGMHLDLPQQTIGSAQILFHRFFTVQSFNQHNHYLTSKTALILACKLDEKNVKYEI